MSNTVKIMHIGDSHLRDAQFARRDRSQDFFNAVVQCINKAHERGITTILHTGDLIDQSRPSSNVIRQVRTLNEKLKGFGITMYTISGNHDATEPHWIDVIRDRQDTGTGIRLVDNQAFDVNGVQVFALPHMSRENLANVAGLHECHVLMWHGPVKEFCAYPTETAITKEELFQAVHPQVQLIALGDIHTTEFSQLHPDTGCTMGYCGSTELCSSNEPLEKFAVVHSFSVEDSQVRYTEREAIPLKTRQVIPIKIAGESDVESAIKLITDAEDEAPIVFLKYSPEISDCIARVKRSLKSDRAILRVKPFKVTHAPKSSDVSLDEDTSPSDFLYLFVPKDSDLYDVGVKLLNPKNHVLDTLDEFIEKREALIHGY